MVVAQAQKIEVAGDRSDVYVSRPPSARCATTFEQHHAWLEALAQQVAGRRIAVAAVQTAQGDPAEPAAPPVAGQAGGGQEIGAPPAGPR